MGGYRLTPEQEAQTGLLPASPDEALRRQCLEWAFQSRDVTGVAHMNVMTVAQSYYDFIKGKSAWENGMTQTDTKPA